MSSFDAIAFKVGAVAPGMYPHLSDESPIPVYRCRAKFTTTADYRAMWDRRSRITPEPILGTLDAFIHVEAGVGAKTLIVPDESGVTITFANAYLVSIRGETDGRVANRYIADLEFAVRGEITP